MKKARVGLVMIVLLATSATAVALDLTDQQLARYHALNRELRCLICQNRSIAQSDAPLAADLRKMVARQIANGRSNDQIKQYLVDRYGEWVLYDPPFQWSTWLLWLGPFGLLGVGLVIVVVMMRRRRAGDAPARRLDRQRLAQVLEQHDTAPGDSGDRDPR